MKCSKCHYLNPKGAKYCNECGSKLSSVCYKCGQVNSLGSNFCNSCGGDLREMKQTSAPVADRRRPSYTPKFLSETYLASQAVMEGERKPVTVMFADVANSTRLFESIDPEEVHWILDRYFKLLMDEIHRYGGTINQFMGDGVMALFGAPVAHEDHAHRACRAALSIQRVLAGYEDKIRKDYGVDFKIRIGLNSGPIIVGAIGDDLRMDYTAVGNTVNLARRFESLAKPGTTVLSADTKRLVQDFFDLKPLGRVVVKGSRVPQAIYELISAETLTSMEASVKRGLTHFVGRVNSMAALKDAFVKVKSGSGQIVSVAGEAGVGKSRLLYEFRHQLPADEFVYLEGRCVHFGSSMPYLPILDILRSYFGIIEGEQESIAKKRVRQRILALDPGFNHILAPIQDILSLEVDDESYLKLEPQQKKEKIFEGLRDLIVKGSQENPLIIAVEDLHWVDKASEAFIDYFIGWMAKINVMLILLHRPEYTHSWASKSYFNKVGVIQLTHQSSIELIDGLLGGAQTAPEVYDLIMTRAGGNPLYIEELTNALVEDGSIQKKGETYQLTRSEAQLQVPDTIYGIIAARIDRLEEDTKIIMQLASVIGREFEFRILQGISEMKEDIKARLLSLQGLELIYEKSVFPTLEFMFKHALTVEVTYNSLLSNKRKQIHRSIGRAIEELYGSNLEEYYEMLSYHYTKGEHVDKAIQYSKRAGEKAARNHALWEAYGFYGQAVDLLEKLPESVEKNRELIDVIQLMRVPVTFLGFPEDALRFLQLGVQLAKEMGDNRRLASFYALLGSYYSFAGDHQTSTKYTESGFKRACKVQEIDLMVPLGLTLSTSYYATSRYDRFVRTMPEVIELIEAAGRGTDSFSISLNPYSYISGGCGASLGHMGEFEKGEVYLRKALENALKIGDPATLGATRFYYSWLLYAKGDYERLKSQLEECIPHFEEAKWHLGVALASCLLGHVNIFLGTPDMGIQLAEKCIHIYQESGIKIYLSWCDWVIGNIYLDLGEPDKAENFMNEALGIALKNREKGVEGLSLLGLGRVTGKIRPARQKQAEDYFSSGLDILEERKMKPWRAQGHMFLGEFYSDMDQQGKAAEHLEIAGKMFKELGMDYWLARAQVLIGAGAVQHQPLEKG